MNNHTNTHTHTPKIEGRPPLEGEHVSVGPHEIISVYEADSSSSGLLRPAVTVMNKVIQIYSLITKTSQ